MLICVYIFFNVDARPKIWIETSNQQMAITRGHGCPGPGFHHWLLIEVPIWPGSKPPSVCTPAWSHPTKKGWDFPKNTFLYAPVQASQSGNYRNVLTICVLERTCIFLFLSVKAMFLKLSFLTSICLMEYRLGIAWRKHQRPLQTDLTCVSNIWVIQLNFTLLYWKRILFKSLPVRQDDFSGRAHSPCEFNLL